MKRLSWSLMIAVGVVGCADPAMEFPVSEERPVELTIGAQIADETKTVSDEYFNTVWSADDCLALFSGETTDKANHFEIDPACAGLTSATFTGSVEKQGEVCYALYPYAGTARMTGGRLEFDVPATQKYRAGGFGSGSSPMVAYGNDPGRLVFRNLFGIVELSLTGPGGTVVRSIRFESSRQYLSGRGGVMMDYGDGIPRFDWGPENGAVRNRYVVLENIGEELDPETPKKFHLVIPALEYTGGLTLTIDTETSGTMIVRSDAEFTIGRSRIKRFSTVDFRAVSSDEATASYYGTTNCIEMTPEQTSVVFDCAPYFTTSENFAYENCSDPSSARVRGVRVLWCDTQADWARVSLDEAAQTITVEKAPGITGNALVAVYADDLCESEILWSFHVWAHPSYPDKAVASGNGSWQMMDLNLGAVASGEQAGAVGLYYQWGRKDPMRGVQTELGGQTVDAVTFGEEWPIAVASTSSTGTVAYATAHPMTFIKGCATAGIYHWMYVSSVAGLKKSAHRLWGNPNTGSSEVNASAGVKSIYDPCPAGYRVAPDMAFAEVSTASRSEYGCEVLMGTEGDTAYFLASGRRNYRTGAAEAVGIYGYYATASMRNSHLANYLYIQPRQSSAATYAGDYASYGRTIRCVRE